MVSGTIPPICKDTSDPMAVVVCFGSRLRNVSLFSPNSLESPYTDPNPTQVPTIIDIKISNLYFFSRSLFLYSGSPSATVAGAMKNVRIDPPALYCSYGIFKTWFIAMINIAEIRSGLSSGNFTFLRDLVTTKNMQMVIVNPNISVLINFISSSLLMHLQLSLSLYLL